MGLSSFFSGPVHQRPLPCDFLVVRRWWNGQSLAEVPTAVGMKFIQLGGCNTSAAVDIAVRGAISEFFDIAPSSFKWHLGREIPMA